MTAMLRLELPHVNVLSKVDMVSRYELAMPLEFFRDAQELRRIEPFCGTKPCPLEDDDDAADADAAAPRGTRRATSKFAKMSPRSSGARPPHAAHKENCIS